MRVAVEVRETVRDQLVRLYYDRVPNLPDAILRTVTDLEEIKRVLTAHGGAPPDAVLRRRGTGGVWWLYANGVWVGYTVEDRSFGWPPLRRTVRTIAVVAVGRPADASDPQ